MGTEAGNDSNAPTPVEGGEPDLARRAEKGAADSRADQPGPRDGAAPARRDVRWLLRNGPAPFIALCVAVCFGLSFGLNYGTDNQTAYMLGALRKLDPTVLASDWYATGPANYHPAFSYVAWPLLALDRNGSAIGWGLVVTATLGAMCVYWLAAELLERRVALATFLLVMAIAFVTRTRSVAVSYIFDFILQPSSLGSLFLLASIAPLVAGRTLMSGIFLGLSGLFHANFLILGIATFGLAQLIIGWQEGWRPLARRLALQIGPSAIVFLLLSPVILQSVGSPDSERAREILFTIRSPHHYSPTHFKGGFFPLAAWQLLGLGVGGWLLRGCAGRGRRLGALIFAFAVLIWSGTLLTTWVQIPQVAQVFVWRFAPFMDLLMQFLACAASASIAARPALGRRVPLAGLTMALGGLVCLAMLDKQGTLASALLVTMAPAVLGLSFDGGARLLGRFRPRLAPARTLLLKYGVYVVIAYSAVSCVSFALPSVKGYRSRSNLLTKQTSPETDLYHWVRAKTPRDALFLSPPRLEGFRLVGERAIIVDWKGSAYAPSELVEWYRRLEDISGAEGFRKSSQVVAGYNRLDAARVDRLKQKYGIDYVVAPRGREKSLPGKVVYRNKRYVVLDLSAT